MLIAVILNLLFFVFELVGGILTGSVAISSDAIHDLGDAVSMGISYLLERKSKKDPDQTYTYGYGRYSVLGGVLTTIILMVGSLAVLVNAIKKIIHPAMIHADGMILFAVFGVIVNLCAVYFTRSGKTVNQKAVNLHMLEDVLGWAVVLVGGIVIRFTGFYLLDPILSIGVAIFILAHAVENLITALNILLEKVPEGIDPSEIEEHLLMIDGVEEVHHLHLWSLDGMHHYGTMHLVVTGERDKIKEEVREELTEHGICHATLELELPGEECHEKQCSIKPIEPIKHCHHH